MRTGCIVLVGCALGIAASGAEKLPNGLDKPFLGCWLGFAESRDFEFLIGGDGTSELFFTKDRNRLTTSGCTLNVYYAVEERVKDKEGRVRWSVRKMQEDGFEDFEEETALPELEKPFSFTATYTGDIKVKVTHLFTKESVQISTELLQKKTENEVRVGVKILVGDLFRHLKEEELKNRELRSKLRDSEIVVWPVDAKQSTGEKFEFHETGVNLTEKFPRGANKFSLESDRFADHECTFYTADEQLGTFIFRQKKNLLHGFYVDWWPDPAKSGEKDCRLVIEVK